MSLSIKLLIVICSFGASAIYAQSPNQNSQVYLDSEGVIRWSGTHQEVALFGANYCLPSACDYRAAKYFTDDLKAEIRKDMTHFARMGWDGLRICFWGDFQNSDSLGNLVSNEHLDLMDYLISEAKRRGIKMLFSPIVTYSSQWPDAMDEKAHGFSAHFKKSELGTSPDAIKAQQNYLRQILNHVNPYTETAIKDEEDILFIEMINEPWHHSNDIEGSVNYINALVDAVRVTGCDKILFHNISQDFNISKALKHSEIQGVSFAWYPSGLVSGETLRGNYLPTVDHFEMMKTSEIKGMPRIVYEFDAPDLLSPVMYPAMVRTFRSVGAQFAAMFAYDMLVTAKANLGWQTHFLNLVYSPQKAASAIIAAEAMHSLPLYETYGNYPANTSFGSFNISYDLNLSEYVTDEAFLYAEKTNTVPPNSQKLIKILGFHSSPLVSYPGEGLYFLDKIEKGVWRLELYPDAVIVKDPFSQMSPDRIVSRLIHNEHPMIINLPDLGTDFLIIPYSDPESQQPALEGKFSVKPGVYTLVNKTKRKNLTLPDKINSIGYGEFVVPEQEDFSLEIVHNIYPFFQTGQEINLSARVVDERSVDSVKLFIRSLGSGFREIPMSEISPYTYQAALPAHLIQDGYYEYCITVYQGDDRKTFPSELNKSPFDWDFYGTEFWPLEILDLDKPFPLFKPTADIDLLNFSRIGDNIRQGIFSLVHRDNTEEGVMRLTLPKVFDSTLEDYTASLYIGNRMKNVSNPLSCQSLKISARGLNDGDEAFITLVESDGLSWFNKITLMEEWNVFDIPLKNLLKGKSVMLPQGFPGNWNYWSNPVISNEGEYDEIDMSKVEQLQISIRNSSGSDSEHGIEISSVSIITLK